MSDQNQLDIIAQNWMYSRIAKPYVEYNFDMLKVDKSIELKIYDMTQDENLTAQEKCELIKELLVPFYDIPAFGDNFSFDECLREIESLFCCESSISIPDIPDRDGIRRPVSRLYSIKNILS